MAGFRVVEQPPSKVTGAMNRLRRRGGSDRVLAIIRVDMAGYVPEQVQLRSRIDPELFTAELSFDRVEQLENDGHVKSISISEPVSLVD